MEWPTCRTCPYWDEYDGSDGECRRFPPDFAGTKSQQRESVGIEPTLIFLGWHPSTLSSHWCGEHPDFPAWIQAQRKTDPPATVE